MVFRATRAIAPGEQIFVDYEWPARDYHFPVAVNGKHGTNRRTATTHER